ncbi:MAG: hypothetical protein U0223_01790 [Nitrospira sp.]
MRFVLVKEVEQQAVLTVHRARQLLVAERTALVNQTRGLLAEYGLIVSTGVSVLRRARPDLLETPALPGLAREVFADLADRLRALDERIATYDRLVAALARQTEPAQHLMQAPGGVTSDSDRAGGHRWECPRLQERPTVCGLAGVGPPATFQRRHPSTGAYHQTRGCLPPHVVDSWRPRCDAATHSPHGCHQSLGPGFESPARIQQGGGGAGCQAGQGPLGAVGHRAPLRGVSLSEPGPWSRRRHDCV